MFAGANAGEKECAYAAFELEKRRIGKRACLELADRVPRRHAEYHKSRPAPFFLSHSFLSW